MKKEKRKNNKTGETLNRFYKSIFLISILLLSSCAKPKPVVNQPINVINEVTTETPIPENKQDNPIEYPIVADKSITNTDSEYYHYKIELRNIANSPNKEWNPKWSYSGKNGGSIGVSNILINNQDLLLIRDPKADFDDYPKISKDEYVDDFIALNPNNKEILWKYQINKINGYQTLIQGDFLFIGTSIGPEGRDESYLVFCLNKNTGKEIWKCSINGITETNMIYSSNKLYFGTNGYDGDFIYCVEATSGKILYQCLGPKNVDFKYNTKFILIDGLLYFSTPDSPSIFSFNITSQEFSLIWKPKKIENMEFMSELTYADPYLLYEGKNDNSPLTLNAINLKTNKIEWIITFETNFSLNYLIESIYDGKHIYFLSYNFLACIDPTTKKLIWSFSEKDHQIQELREDGNIFFLALEMHPENPRDTSFFKKRYILKLNAKSGQIIWKMQKGVRLNGKYKEKLLVSEGKNLYMIDPD
jgi:outer membrane protein assembly factor BamB